MARRVFNVRPLNFRQWFSALGNVYKGEKTLCKKVASTLSISENHINACNLYIKNAENHFL